MFEYRTSPDDLFVHWDELSAYVLGFWFADGYINLNKPNRLSGNYSKRWAICNTDFDGLRQIANAIGYNRDLHAAKRSKVHHKTCYYCYVRSDKLFDFCYTLVGTTQKSHCPITVPSIVPESLFHHFARGFMDGDGSLHIVTYKNRHGKPTSEFRSSFTVGRQTGLFLESLRDRVSRHIPVNNHKKITNGSSRKLTYGQYDSMLLCAWMYQDATIAFDSKRRIWDSTDKTKLAESRKYRPKAS